MSWSQNVDVKEYSSPEVLKDTMEVDLILDL